MWCHLGFPNVFNFSNFLAYIGCWIKFGDLTSATWFNHSDRVGVISLSVDQADLPDSILVDWG